MSYSKPEKVQRKGSHPGVFQKFSLPKISVSIRDHREKINERKNLKRKHKENPPEYIAFYCFNQDILNGKPNQKTVEGHSNSVCGDTQQHIDERYADYSLLEVNKNKEKQREKNEKQKPKIKSLIRSQMMPLKDVWTISPWEESSNKGYLHDGRLQGRQNNRFPRSKSIHNKREADWPQITQVSSTRGLQGYFDEQFQHFHC